MTMFLCSYNYNWLLYLLDNDNIMAAKTSEVVQKVLTDEKIITNAPSAL